MATARKATKTKAKAKTKTKTKTKAETEPNAPAKARESAARSKRSTPSKTQTVTPVQQLQSALCSLLVRMSQLREAAAAAAKYCEYCDNLFCADQGLESDERKSLLANSAAARRLRRLESALTDYWLAIDIALQTLTHASPQLDGIHRGSALAPSAELKGILTHVQASLYGSNPRDIPAADEWNRRCQLACMAAPWPKALAQPQERIAAWYERVIGAALIGDTLNGEWLTSIEAAKRLSKAEGCDGVSLGEAKMRISREADKHVEGKSARLVTNRLRGPARRIEANSLCALILELQWERLEAIDKPKQGGSRTK